MPNGKEQMEFHKIADIFPMLDQAELQDLADDIKANGLLQPIMLFEGRVLDGRNRYKACQAAAVVPRYEQFTGKDALSFVVSANLIRRHLTTGQRAAIGLDIEEIKAKQAKERQRIHGETAPGRPKNTSGNIATTESEGRARDQAAAIMHVSPRNIQEAKKIREVAPKIFERVKSGELSIPEAKREIELPHVAHNAGNNEWYTPKDYIKRAVAVMGGIDLDPASTDTANTIVGAETFYTAKNDGLEKKWRGRVFMNPPYASELIGKFIDKLLHSSGITEAIVLVNNATETKWFQSLAQKADAICFPVGRVKFWNPNKESTPLQGQAVLYLGPNAKKFNEQFSDLGTTWNK